MAQLTDYGDGISAIDSEFLRPQAPSIHLIVERGRAAIVDTGSNDAVPLVLEALAAKGLAPEDVDYLVLTHIHLDHAGGAGLLMTKLPNAKLTVHPRGARHITDPQRLIEGTVAVYGADAARRLYGDLVPVPEARIIETPHEARVALNGRELRFIDTPGHARHCVSIVDGGAGRIFAGDTSRPSRRGPHTRRQLRDAFQPGAGPCAPRTRPAPAAVCAPARGAGGEGPGLGPLPAAEGGHYPDRGRGLQAPGLGAGRGGAVES